MVWRRRERLLREAEEHERLEALGKEKRARQAERLATAREQSIAHASRPSLRHSICVVRKPNGSVFIDIYFRAANGPNMIDGPPLRLESMDDAELLGAAVLEGLTTSYSRILPACNPRTAPPKLEDLQWRGAKTWSEYLQHATSVHVDVYAERGEQGEAIAITPNHNLGRSRSEPIPDAASTLIYESAEQLGRAVQEAMTKATA